MEKRSVKEVRFFGVCFPMHELWKVLSQVTEARRNETDVILKQNLSYVFLLCISDVPSEYM